ncbi:NFACT family protein [soil metagenome]
MEGLLIAEEVAKLETPNKRLSWRFPDAYTFILPLAQGALWLFNRPPNPRIAYLNDMPSPGSAHSGFQDLLVARAVGDLLKVEQLKLDRVVKLHFGAGAGFVPVPPATLIGELTGRNCHLILTDEAGKILGAAREVSSDVNRFRQVRAGLMYEPPPPYDKLDPRMADEVELRQVLTGKSLKKLRGLIDGVGPDLTKALAITSGVSPDKQLEPDDVTQVLPALKRLSVNPSEVMKEALELPDVGELREREARAADQTRLRAALEKERALVQNRLEDIDKARAAARDADTLRGQGDVLMAYQYQVPANVDRVTLPDFAGGELSLQLDPKLSAVDNAQAFYERARKREGRVQQAEAREEALTAELAGLETLLANLPAASDARIKDLLEHHAPKTKAQTRLEPGIRYDGPHGYKVIVGRNAKENDIVTFRIARSRDVWLHVQGYTGSHVVVQADNTEVPFDTVLFAAQLAAAYSKAGASENVPVDYTSRKHVWKAKGGAPGAVHYAHQKTVYVTPSRRPEKDKQTS